MCNRTMLATCVVIMATTAYGGPTDPADAADPAAVTDAAEATRIVALEVVGKVQFRPTSDDPWQELEEGMVLPEGSEVRTGLRSKARLRMGANAEVTLDRLGILNIADPHIEPGNVLMTRLGTRYGRVHFDVKHVGFENDFQIASPGSALAVRGTKGTMESYAQLPEVHGHERNRVDAIHMMMRHHESFLSADDAIDARFRRPEVYAAAQRNMLTTPADPNAAGQADPQQIQPPSIRRLVNVGDAIESLHSNERFDDAQRRFVLSNSPGGG